MLWLAFFCVIQAPLRLIRRSQITVFWDNLRFVFTGKREQHWKWSLIHHAAIRIHCSRWECRTAAKDVADMFARIC